MMYLGTSTERIGDPWLAEHSLETCMRTALTTS